MYNQNGYIPDIYNFYSHKCALHISTEFSNVLFSFDNCLNSKLIFLMKCFTKEHDRYSLVLSRKPKCAYIFICSF